jgi:ATP-dependent Lon protease
MSFPSGCQIHWGSAKAGQTPALHPEAPSSSSGGEKPGRAHRGRKCGATIVGLGEGIYRADACRSEREPLVEVPPLHQVREALLFEFPYARDVIDFALADLVGHATVRLRPLLLVGDPGGGKSRFARRLGELLGVGIWREDASRADGAVFAGTDRRWYSSEPCHPLLAVAAGKIANPLVLLDEIEKSGTRSDYGRLWDCLLGFFEPETSARYMCPALQVNLELSQISYVCTANSLDPLPAPLRDRMRIVTFPKPGPGDLDALLAAVIAEIANERSLDQNWVPPLDGEERALAARYWHGGSVRRLRRIVSERDRSSQ